VVAIDLPIDSDAPKTPSVRLPRSSVARPHVAAIAVDRRGAFAPYEERAILDRRLFRDFQRRATEPIASPVPDPMVRDRWATVVARMDQTNKLGIGRSLGACPARSRHPVEGRMRQRNLKTRLSRICAPRSFGRDPPGFLVLSATLRLPVDHPPPVDP